MIRWMRIANAVLASLAFLGFTLYLLQNPSENLGRDDQADIYGQLVGMAVWIVPIYLAWRGLGPDSTMGMVGMAQLANIAAPGLIALLSIGLIVAMAKKITPLVEVLPVLLIMLIVTIPFALNIAALGKRQSELEETNTDQTPEPIEVQASPDVPAAVSSEEATHDKI